MKKIISMFFLLLLTTIATIPLEAQNKVWPPKSFPAKVSFKVINSIYYWKIQSVICLGKSNGGYKFRIKGIGKHDASDLTIGTSFLNVAVEEQGHKLKSTGTYVFPRVKEGEIFTLDIVTAFSGMYSPARFVGLAIFSDHPREEEPEIPVPEPPQPVEILEILEIVDDQQSSVVEETTNEPEDNTLYKTAETMPEFPGGSAAMMNFISQNLKYPEAAVKKQIEGRVIIEFTVYKDGSIINPVVVRSIDPDLDNEALRIIKIMPTWKPGTNKGKAINVKHTLPFNFRLN